MVLGDCQFPAYAIIRQSPRAIVSISTLFRLRYTCFIYDIEPFLSIDKANYIINIYIFTI